MPKCKKIVIFRMGYNEMLSSVPIVTDIARKIKENANLRRFHEPEIISVNKTEKQVLIRGEQLRRRVIQSL